MQEREVLGKVCVLDALMLWHVEGHVSHLLCINAHEREHVGQKTLHIDKRFSVESGSFLNLEQDTCASLCSLWFGTSSTPYYKSIRLYLRLLTQLF